ncbi:hypothetical protein K3757_18895 (plasmid) [Sulfitobacter sp. S223]|uniref:hypothetical protein n=1 Tax=Sulfitobacter sp. S223 TaxID=2867023 RepID=UPI0021A5E19C|nr:hypothetical protein [Sulfitobacter sp. S223]UWR28327.1 hypothetical protein K3757_18895 [Sulfitobacter sp. S223]
MNQGVVQNTTSKAVTNSFDALAPLSSKALFWRARYAAPSPFLEHVPLLFWTVENARPNMVVCLGVADAVPYFAACQAIEKLNIEAVCFGIETETDVDLDDIELYNEHHFSDFSEIFTANQADLAQNLQAAQIDFLIINKPVTQALLDEIDSIWAPLLSDRALILFAQGGDAALLAKYSDKIALDGGVFLANPLRGVRLVLRGRQHNDRLMRLTQLQPGKPGYLNVKNVFSRLGEWHSMFVQGRDASDILKAAHNQRDQALSELAEKKRQLTEGQARLAQLEDRLKAATDQLATRSTAPVSAGPASTGTASTGTVNTSPGAVAMKVNTAAGTQPRPEQARLLETERSKNAELLARIRELEDTHATEIDALEQQRQASHKQLSQALAQAAKQRDTLQATVNATGGGMQQRDKELAALTQILEEREQRLQQQSADLSKANSTLAKTTRDLKQAKARLEREKRYNQTLLQLAAAKQEIATAISSRRISKTYRAMRAELDKQITITKESGLFDEAWYKTTYPDIAASALSPAEHFVQMGAFEGRNPGPEFDSMEYHMADPAIAANKMPALLHYLRHGKAEGRAAIPVKT